MIKVTKSPKETRKLAGFLFKKIGKSGGAVIIALEGELGAGKTTFVQGLAGILGVKSKVKSPTFALMKKYHISTSKNFKFLYHLDCYRLRDHKDLITLGIKDILSGSGNIVLIEWSDRVKKILPKKHIKIHIDHIDKNERKIKIEFKK